MLLSTDIEGHYYYTKNDCMVSSHIVSDCPNDKIIIDNDTYYFIKDGLDISSFEQEPILIPTDFKDYYYYTVENCMVSKYAIPIDSDNNKMIINDKTYYFRQYGLDKSHKIICISELIFDKSVILDYRVKWYGGSFNIDNTVWDKALIEFVFKIIKNIPSCVFFDIGASTGSFTLLSKFTDCTMHSFEPNPTIFKILKSNVQLNEIDNRVTLYELGLVDSYDENKHFTLKYPIDDDNKLIFSGLSTFGNNPKRFAQYNYKEIKVKTNTLDNIADQLNLEKIDFIKMDTEGFEYYILEGGYNTIKKYLPIMILECNEENMSQCDTNKEKLFKLLDELEYAYTFVSEEDLLCISIKNSGLMNLYADATTIKEVNNMITTLVNNNIEDLYINGVSNLDAEFLNALRKNKSLKCLSIIKTKLTDEAINVISEFLKDISTLQKLEIDFSANANCSDATLNKISSQIAYNTTIPLRHLSYSNCKLGDKNFMVNFGSIIEQILTNKNLRTLALDNIGLDDDYIKQLGRIFYYKYHNTDYNTTLEKLDVKNNEKVTDIGINEIIEAFEENKKDEKFNDMNIIKINTSGTSVSEDKKMKLQEYLDHHLQKVNEKINNWKYVREM